MIPFLHRVPAFREVLVVAASLWLFPGIVSAVEFATVQPLFEKYCSQCHNAEKEEGHLNLEQYKTYEAFTSNHELLEHLEWVLSSEEMPPMKSAQPTQPERESMLALVEQSLASLTNAQPNDPGVVVMPRMNMNEYDYVVRDLTGLDLALGQYLTADGVGGEGFLNVGANQMMSVGQFEGFLSTAKKLLNHARFIPGGSVFWSPAPLNPVNNDAELKKETVAAWEEWHTVRKQALIGAHEAKLKRQLGMVWEAYAEAAWQYYHRAAFGLPEATYEQVAGAYEVPLFPGALEMTYRLLTRDPTLPGADKLLKNPFYTEFIRQWEAIPGPRGQDPAQQRAAFKSLAKWRELASATNDFGSGAKEGDLDIPPKNKEEKQALRGLYHKGEPQLAVDLDKAKDGRVYLAVAPIFGSSFMPPVVFGKGEFVMQDGSRQPWQRILDGFENQDGAPVAFGQGATGAALGADEVGLTPPGYLAFEVPAKAKELHVEMVYADPKAEGIAAVRVAPFDAPPADYFETFRGRRWVGRRTPAFSGRLAELAEHLAVMDSTNTGYTRLRDGLPWVGEDPAMLEFFGVQVPKSNWSNRLALFALSAGDIRRNLTEDQQAELDRLRTQLAMVQAAAKLEPGVVDQKAVELIGMMAGRLWRRPPSQEEVQQLAALYQTDRAAGLCYEQAIKTPLTALLVAPSFLYRFTEAQGKPEPYPLSDPELATRLAFVLWGSLPDDELLRVAYQNQLANPEMLRAQIERMIRDPRARNFIEEFTGMWLGFAGFSQFGGPDAEKYKEFDDDLKVAMHEEAVAFFLDLLRSDKPVTLAFDADYTFLNERLAKHYNIDGVQGDEMRLVKLDTDQRGGIFGMGTFLTKYSAPLRTSPVHRGIWLYEKVLGLPIPEPPPNVPLLSDEEVDGTGKTVAQQLAQHREDPACSSCHERFDPLGVALENYDPIGKWRTTTGGQPVDARGAFLTGQVIEGLPALQAYMGERRQFFIENFCRKLLGYTLGRALLPTDKPVLEAMMQALETNGYQFRAALETAIFSPQFRMRRDEEIRPKAALPLSDPHPIANN